MKAHEPLSAGRSTPVPHAIRAEAAAWLARLHGGERSREMEAGFKRWLAADPLHEQAFEIATEAWEMADGIRMHALSRPATGFKARNPPLPRLRAWRWRLALTACAIVVGALLYANLWRVSIVTAVGEQRMFTMEDGSRVFLNTDTRLSVRQSWQRREVFLERGEAMFDVAKNPHRPFVVTAGGQEVVALGTAFVVRSDPHRLSVTLIEGKVAVAAASAGEPGATSLGELEKQLTQPGEPSNQAVVLTPGQRLTVEAAKPVELDVPPPEQVNAWRHGEIVLDKTLLKDAVAEFNRYSATQLLVNDPAIGAIAVSGIFRVGDSTRFAQAVAEIHRLKLVQQDRRIVISGS